MITKFTKTCFFPSLGTDPPEFTSVSAYQSVVEGDPGKITLECIAIGEPPPNLTWTRAFDSSSDSDVLFTGEQLILVNNRSSTGTYRCTAYNGIGTAPNRTIAVDVNCKLSIDMQNNGWLPSMVYTYLLFGNDLTQWLTLIWLKSGQC